MMAWELGPLDALYETDTGPDGNAVMLRPPADQAYAETAAEVAADHAGRQRISIEAIIASGAVW